MRSFLEVMRGVVVVFFAVLLSGCANHVPYRNEPLPREKAASEYSADVTEIRDTVLPRCRDRSKTLSECPASRETAFIGIAISGGGSRAANFAGAVLQELSDMGIMPHVNAISSVSGGSVAAAYYVSRRKDLVGPEAKADGWITAKADLSQPFRSRWVKKLLTPNNLSATLFGSTGRTEYLADVFDATLFSKMRIGELSNDGPALIINATPINQLNSRAVPSCTNRGYLSPWMRWESISFNNWFFNGCLNSRLDTYPLSLAVAASAAFPGVFSSVPLARWDVQTRPDNTYVKTVAAEFLHVIDGGPSDNLGIDGLIAGMASDAAVDGDVDIDHCLVISIDAFVRGGMDERALKADPRGVIGRIVDLNFFDAIDAMLARRRFDTLQRIGVAPPQFKDSERFVSVQDFPFPGMSYQFFVQDHVATMNISPREALGESTEHRERLYADGHREKIREPVCTIWHVGLDNLRSTLVAGMKFGPAAGAKGERSIGSGALSAELQKIVRSPEGQHRVAVAEIASRVRTDFDLVGPENCSSDELSDVLWEAGRIAVAADQESRGKVCSWFKDVGLPVSDGCDAPDPAIRGESVAVAFVRSSNPIYGEFEVICKKAVEIVTH